MGWFRGTCILLFASLAGCTGVGTLSIQGERNSYNDVIHDTTTEQLLLNIVRAHYFETPSFFDVIEVDQQKTLQANLQGGSSNIGATAILGALSSTLTAADSPIIKYQPPSSAGYIQQVVQPIGLANLARLINSNVNIAPLLRLSLDRLTPAYMDYFWASDIINSLDTFGAIRVDAIDDATIKITLLPYGLLTLDAARRIKDTSLDCLDTRGARRAVANLWINLTLMLGTPNQATIPLKLASSSKHGGVVVTRSALGALRIAEGADAKDVAFVERDEADALREENRVSRCYNGQYYYLRDAQQTIQEKWISQFELLVSNWPSQETSKKIRTLGHDRALIIVEESTARPADAYVAIFRKGVWYSIADKDQVSKKNFALLGNLLIIQAQPPSSPPTQTVIGAGGLVH
jgi:hypothetical protein